MAKNNKEKTYWPHMILGFLILGITLSYWTVKSASSMPVQESNNYMLKYQLADMNINEIIKREKLFNQNYTISLLNVKKEMVALENTKRVKEEHSVVLAKGQNSFAYSVETREGSFKDDADVTFLLTRPHDVSDDILVENVKVVDGKFVINDINITKAGRYTLQLRAKVGEAIGYSEIPAYLKP
ncbi:MAG: hypothetical protein ABFQ64_10700 [Campylobacterota bacterium]